MKSNPAAIHLTRIVATVGPASSSPEMVEKLIGAGVDVFRLNFSHGSHEQHEGVYRTIRSVAEKLGQWVAIMQDISGPKLRIGEFTAGSIELAPGGRFRLQRDLPAGDVSRVGFKEEGWFEFVAPAHRMVLGDGQIVLRIIRKDDQGLDCEVLSGGTVRSRWGLNFPDSRIELGAITEKDRIDIAFGKQLGVDAMAISFVQSADDLKAAKAVLGNDAPHPLLIAKIEHPVALERIDSIIAEADGIMVARGDLGITIPIEQVPTVQKRLIHLCRDRGKLVITATQMLESMTTAPQPTRAEVTDVANAGYDGTDAVMLSGETAVGTDPVRVVDMMGRILREAEPHALFPEPPRIDRTIEGAMAVAVADLVKELKARVVLVPITSGSTAARISRQRVGVPIVAGATDTAAARKMKFYSGVFPVLTDGKASLLNSLKIVLAQAQARKWVKNGDHAIATGGFPVTRRGITNFVRAITVGEEL
jgi:pyruvate kinase